MKTRFDIVARLIVLSLLFWYKPLEAQSLSELVELIDVENLELKVLEHSYQAALQRAPQIDEYPDPEFSIGAFPFPVETRLGGQLFRLSATQMIPWPGLLKQRAELEKTKAKTEYEKISNQRLNLVYVLKRAYFALYELKKSQLIIQQNIELLEALEKIALAKVKAGKATAADVLRVQLKTQELLQEIEILESKKAGPRATINQLLNRDSNLLIDPTDELSFAELPYDRKQIIATIKSKHPALKILDLQQEVSKEAINLNDLSGKPSFGVGLDYINVTGRTDFEPERNGRDIIQLRASIKIPIHRNKYSAKRQEEEHKILALQKKKQDVLLQFSAGIEQAFAEHETERLRVALYQKQIELVRSSIQILQIDYSARDRNFDELLRLERELVDYQLKTLKSIVNSHIAKSIIERYIGA